MVSRTILFPQNKGKRKYSRNIKYMVSRKHFTVSRKCIIEVCVVSAWCFLITKSCTDIVKKTVLQLCRGVLCRGMKFYKEEVRIFVFLLYEIFNDKHSGVTFPSNCLLSCNVKSANSSGIRSKYT